MDAQLQGRDILVFVYGMACPLRCDFCCHPVEEYGPVKMGKEEVIDWIYQASEIPSFGLVVFTGGEPFVYYREILEVLKATRALNFRVRIVTAGHWARSVEVAKEKLLPLQENGLTELSVSTDPSHQAFVPAEYAENALKAALELGVTAEVAGVFWDPDSKVEDYVRIPQGTYITRHLAIPIGRGKNRKVTPEDYRLGPERFRGCGRYRAFDVTIYPDGEVYPCCSGGFNIQAKLSFGNARKEPLRDIVGRIHQDLYTRLVMETGFITLYELARFKFPDLLAQLPEMSSYLSPCQLCVRIHSDPSLMQLLEPVMRYADGVLGGLEELVLEEREARRAEVPLG